MRINLTAEDQACVNSAINGFIISDLGEKLLNNGSGLDSKIGQNSLSLYLWQFTNRPLTEDGD